MLTRLHAEGWCLVDFFKPADWIYTGYMKKGGGTFIRGGAFIRDNTVYTKNIFILHHTSQIFYVILLDVCKMTILCVRPKLTYFTHFFSKLQKT